ncbi:alpha/beta hydrolase [Nocardia cyriacigeorgica]|uniref:Alpha/beta hydrolase n=1 Tax=Nocardia cyriacigeorgica TaxID=135487 RepID=A0A6P1D5I9_9NOCA|nr:alpha/beta hydrolase fold domain-containing protein [Nocardia cyriacigeorgica]NEW45687.1 alpha/beta hydrolase [Nocardia cyriacigeorgica]NEW55402.1 alpha/beta hydrolase [Nocardia cyriacigeorgica]
MPSAEHEEIVQQLIDTTSPADPPTLDQMRENYDQLMLRYAVADSTTITSHSADGVGVDLVTTPGADPEQCVAFIHGGGFVLGSVRGYHEYASRISVATKSTVALIDYRRAPEAVAPAAREDCVKAYCWLAGRVADTVSLMGDSAGGGLALLLGAQLAKSDAPTPAAVVALSPWIDVAVRAEMPDQQVTKDPMLSPAGLRWFADTYLAGVSGDNPEHNALNADLTGMPATLLQTGTRDVTHQDSVLFTERARAAGVDVVLDVYDGLIHDWHSFGPALPEGKLALARVGDFLTAHAGQGGAVPAAT